MMFVVPEAVRSPSLFIDEIYSWANMGDLSEPSRGNAGQKTDPVLDQLTRVHLSFAVGDNAKRERRWSDRV